MQGSSAIGWSKENRQLQAKVLAAVPLYSQRTDVYTNVIE
jgi:hypothetical protein